MSKQSDARWIPFSPPDVGEEEIAEVAEAMRSGWITTGPRTKAFEKRLARYMHTNKVVCLGSGTAAEELNLRILGIGKGDEVIVPAYTYTATASAAIHVGAKVIFVDSQPNSFEMDYDQMEAAITEKTKAIVAADLAGLICDYDRIYQAVENKKSLFTPSGNTELGRRIQKALGRVAVIADAAHAMGASRNGVMAGAIADFTSISFHAVKNFTTAEGGASTWRKIEGIDDEELYTQYQLYSLHGQSKDALAKTVRGSWEYDVIGPWYKCNMTDITAAIGLRQLDRYPSILERRKEIIARYDEMCDSLGLIRLNHFANDHKSSGHLYMVRIPNAGEQERGDIIAKMSEEGIACNVHFKPLPMMTAYKEYGWDIKDFPNAYNFYQNEITLPLHTKLSDEDVDYIIDKFTSIVKKYI